MYNVILFSSKTTRGHFSKAICRVDSPEFTVQYKPLAIKPSGVKPRDLRYAIGVVDEIPTPAGFSRPKLSKKGQLDNNHSVLSPSAIHASAASTSSAAASWSATMPSICCS